MARKVEVKLVDDIDGGVADETLKFSLDGTLYEIDLSSKHADLGVAASPRLVAGAVPAPRLALAVSRTRPSETGRRARVST